jgi:phycoerythrin-associated linker protein
MSIDRFVAQSIGRWKSQRSAHSLAFQHFEAVLSTIDILTVEPTDDRAIALCKSYDIDPSAMSSPFYMQWEGTTDWDDDQVMKGSTVLVPVPDPADASKGRLLREQGYAETMAAVGNYHFTNDGVFVLITPYDRASAEERIWFVNPNLRFRVSTINTSEGTGVLTASFSSEVRSAS